MKRPKSMRRISHKVRMRFKRKLYRIIQEDYLSFVAKNFGYYSGDRRGVKLDEDYMYKARQRAMT